MPDVDGRPADFTFDLVQGTSPLLLGQDVRIFCNTSNLSNPKFIMMKRPTDTSPRKLYTYHVPLDTRLRLDVAQHQPSTQKTLMSGRHTNPSTAALDFVKRIHRYTHATDTEMEALCTRQGRIAPVLKHAIHKVFASCEICARNGLPKIMRKVSITNITKTFNTEIQVDYFWTEIRGSKIIALNMTDCGTSYSEMAIARNRTTEHLVALLEKHWILKHGAPCTLSADPELSNAALVTFLSHHSISFNARPARRHNKTGIVERKNGTVKRIIAKLNFERTSADSEAIFARAVFLSNMFSGSRIISSFQLARGYAPSILGLPQVYVTQELLDSHRDQVSTRALQRLLDTRAPNTVPQSVLQKGQKNWIFYKSSQQNQKPRWIKAVVEEARQHLVLARRSSRGPPLRVAYEDLRIAPDGPLTEELLSGSLEDELEKRQEDTHDNETSTPNEASRPNLTTPPTMEEETPAYDDRTEPITRTANHFPPILLGKRIVGDTSRDFGEIQASEDPFPVTDLQSDRELVLEQISSSIGTQTFSRKKLEFAPAWILEESLHAEHESNWKDAYTEVEEGGVPASANVITSHVVYRVKEQETGSRSLKARIVPHGNRDVDRFSVRTDSSNAQFDIIRLLLAITTILQFRLAIADIKGAYLQSGPIKRDIYVRPPREWKGLRGWLWKLLKLPYGIVKAGRQWQTTVEKWMLEEAGLQRLFGIGQLYCTRNAQGYITILVAKVTDDFLISGTIKELHRFVNQLKSRFIIGKVVIDDKIFFNGCTITQNETGDITMDMNSYVQRLHPIQLTRSRKKENDRLATKSEVTAYKSMCGTLNFPGMGVLPQASFAASYLQQRSGRILVSHLREANAVAKEILQLKPVLKFLAPKHDQIIEAMISTFSDASFNIRSSQDYGQTGFITGLHIRTSEIDNIYHVIDWSSHKQRRVSYSSYGAEILACADADDRGFYLKKTFHSIFPTKLLRHVLQVDSRGLYDTVTTLHKGKEYRLRQTVQRIRNSFEATELDILRWIPGTINIADALTKRSIKLYELLNQVCVSGRLLIDLDIGYALDSRTWK